MDIYNYAIGVGYNGNNEAVCLILSVDSLESGGEVAIQSDSASLLENDLRLNAETDTLVLKNMSAECVSLIKAGAPIVVLDPKNNSERLVTVNR